MQRNKKESTDAYEDIQMVNVESEYLFKTYEIMHGKVWKYFHEVNSALQLFV